MRSVLSVLRGAIAAPVILLAACGGGGSADTAPEARDGMGSEARFLAPLSIGVDTSSVFRLPVGDLYVGDQNIVRRISLDGRVSTFATLTAPITGIDFSGGIQGGSQHAWVANGAVLDVRAANSIHTLTATSQATGVAEAGNEVVYATLSGRAEILRIENGQTTAVPTPAPVTAIAAAPDGAVYLLEGAPRNTVRRRNPDGSFVVVAGPAGFTDLRAISVGRGDHEVVLIDGNAVRAVLADGAVTTLAGSVQESGYRNGAAGQARFNRPLGLVAEGGGNVFVADTGNRAIRKIDFTGAVSTLAGAGPAQ